MAPIRRNTETDTIEVSATAFNFFIGLLSAFIAGIAWVGYSVVVDHVRVAEQVRHLVGFANKGERNTAADGRARDRRLEELEDWKDAHQRWGRQLAGKWDAQHESHESRLDRLESRGHLK